MSFLKTLKQKKNIITASVAIVSLIPLYYTGRGIRNHLVQIQEQERIRIVREQDNMFIRQLSPGRISSIRQIDSYHSSPLINSQSSLPDFISPYDSELLIKLIPFESYTPPILRRNLTEYFKDISKNNQSSN